MATVKAFLEYIVAHWQPLAAFWTVTFLGAILRQLEFSNKKLIEIEMHLDEYLNPPERKEREYL